MLRCPTPQAHRELITFMSNKPITLLVTRKFFTKIVKELGDLFDSFRDDFYEFSVLPILLNLLLYFAAHSESFREEEPRAFYFISAGGIFDRHACALEFSTRLLPKTNMAEHAVPAPFYANDVVFSLGKDWLIKEVSVINLLSASLKTIASL